MEKVSENKLVMAGTVMNCYYPNPNKKIAVMILATKGSSAKTNFPRIAFYGNERLDAIQAILKENPHPHVFIKGVVQTNKKVVNEQTFVFQTNVGQSIMESPKKLDALAESKGTTPIDDINKVSFIGDVVYILPMKGNAGYVVTIKAYDDNSHFSFPRLICFSRNCKSIEGLKVGDTVAAVGMIQTQPKTKMRENERMESIVCSDIVILAKDKH